MRIKEIHIHSFRSLRCAHLTFPETRHGTPPTRMLTTIGKNNGGKSSILEAVTLALPGSETDAPLLSQFPNHNTSNGPIEVEFVFTVDDPQDLDPNLRELVLNEQITLRKSWPEAKKKAAWDCFYAVPSVPVVMNSAKRAREHFMDDPVSKAMVEAYEQHEDITLDELTKPIKKSVVKWVKENAPTLLATNAGWQTLKSEIVVTLEPLLPHVVLIPAVRDGHEEADAIRGKGAASQLVDQLVIPRVLEQPAYKAFEKAAAEIKDLFSGDSNKLVSDLQKDIQDRVKRIIDLDIRVHGTPGEPTNPVQGAVSLQVRSGSEWDGVSSQGHGAQRALILALLELLGTTTLQGSKRELVVLIEEPEIYLHPQMQRRMRDALLDLARKPNVAVVATTHSPVFIDLEERYDALVFMRPLDEGQVTHQPGPQLESELQKHSARNHLRMLWDFHEHVKEAFFAPRPVIVEGPSELSAMKGFLQRLLDEGSYDAGAMLGKWRQVHMLNAGGKQNVHIYQQVLSAFEVPHVVIYDRDRQEELNDDIRTLAEDKFRLELDPDLEMHLWGVNGGSRKWKDAYDYATTKPISDRAERFIGFVLGCNLESLKL